jgi:hypothetical protein
MPSCFQLPRRLRNPTPDSATHSNHADCRKRRRINATVQLWCGNLLTDQHSTAAERFDSFSNYAGRSARFAHCGVWLVAIYIEIIMPMNRKNMEDEIEGDFVPPPEKTLAESIQEARGLSEELREMQSHLEEDFGFPFILPEPPIPKKTCK